MMMADHNPRVFWFFLALGAIVYSTFALVRWLERGGRAAMTENERAIYDAEQHARIERRYLRFGQAVLIAFCVSSFLGMLYGLIRFVKWAWAD